MTDFESRFAPFKALMQAEDLPEAAVRTFAYYYRQLLEGATGLIPEANIEPARDIPHTASFGDRYRQTGQDALAHTVLIKLNGGLGTSMGMTKAKSLLPVKDGLSFLDIIARHARGAGVPLLLMNSFATQADSLAALKAYPDLAGSAFGLDFLQHKFPKILQDGLAPAAQAANPDLGWNPPGHGDLYPALLTSGALDRLLESGFEFAFVSNGDNLGAALDSDLLGYFAQNAFPFMMEVAARTAADRKGGHLAVGKDGGLLLRESAQCPPEDMPAFQDIERHAYFNTNNLWLYLPALKARLKALDGVLGLPLIRNRKMLDPRDPHSPPVYQLETAMGSAIHVFPDAAAVCVPRTRFSPVKTTADLLTVRSDAYRLTEDFRVEPLKPDPPLVELDPRFFRLIDQLEKRFPAGPPSLLDCTRLMIDGDVAFGTGVRITGAVEIHNPPGSRLVIPDSSHLQGE